MLDANGDFSFRNTPFRNIVLSHLRSVRAQVKCTMWRYILGLILIHAVFITPLTAPGFYRTHDGENHVVRIGTYFKAFRDWHIPPRWAGDLNYRYGTPVLSFFYPLPGYIGSAFHAFGISLQGSFKLLAAAAFLLGPVGFFLWLSRFLPLRSAFTGSIFYGLAPYHFLNLYVRGDIGELLALAILPFVFLFLEKIRENPSNRSVLFGGISYALLILSHNAVSFLFTPVILTYALFRATTNTKRRNACLLLAVGLALSAYFWIPALVESRFTNIDLYLTDFYRQHFPTLGQLFWSPWGFGPDVTAQGGLSPQIGPLHGIVVFLGLFSFTVMKDKKMAFFWFAVLGLALFFSTSASSFFWRQLPAIQKLEFPWRFTAVTSTASAVIAGYTFAHMNNVRIDTAFIALLIVLASSYIALHERIDFPDSYYFTFPDSTYYHGEASTRWFPGEPYEFPKQPLSIIEDGASIRNYTRTTTSHRFVVNASKPVRIALSVLYFPGWRVLVNDQKTPIEFQDPLHPGLITFSVPEGTSRVSVTFGESPVRLISDVLSLITIAAIAFSFVLDTTRKKIP